MKLGVTQREGKTYCQNCHAEVIDAKNNYCSRCGNPLSQKGVDEYGERLLTEKREVLRALDAIAKKENIDKLSAVLDIYLDEHTEI